MGIVERPPKRERENDFMDTFTSVIAVIFIVLGVWKAGEIAYFVSERVEITIKE